MMKRTTWACGIGLAACGLIGCARASNPGGEQALIYVDNKPLDGFSPGRSEYHYYTGENSPGIPLVSVKDGRGKVPGGVEIIQAAQLPDCALVTLNGAVYRIRFIPRGRWESIDAEGNAVTVTRPEDELKTPYDGDGKKIPERPYFHDYSQTLTVKMFLARPVLGEDGKPAEGQSEVHLRFDEARELIKQLDALTLGVPKIVYLTGWQRDGHDDQYPSWLPVNEALAFQNNSGGATADLNVLIREAREQYHTAVSLHINSSQGYENSPLWDMFQKNGLILRRHGTEKYNGLDTYLLNLKHYWESGFYKAQVDQLLETLPELAYSKTIHSDAFLVYSGPGESFREELAARRQIIRYWHDRGFDLTSEFVYGASPEDEDTHRADNDFFPGDPAADPDNLLTGLVPYAYHLVQSDAYFESRPAALLTGGTDRWSQWGPEKGDTTPFQRWVYGGSTVGDHLFPYNQNEPRELRPDFLREFCTLSVPYFYQNRFPNAGVSGSGDTRKGVKTDPSDPASPLTAQYAA
ncbi:MAG: endo-alpha-N-acetylgalactosaminidase family protein, partial [Treponema sp.]|nr:endo-alpha-N-acetylgalactosaminidase family protein [Treponema sp.]